MPAKKDKMEEDFAPKVDTQFRRTDESCTSKNNEQIVFKHQFQSGEDCNEAVENLLALEKQTRQVSTPPRSGVKILIFGRQRIIYPQAN